MTVPRVVRLSCILGALVLFALLAWEMVEGETRRFDGAVREFVHFHSPDWLTAAMRGFTWLGSTLVVAIVATCSFAALWVEGLRRRAVEMAIIVGGGGLLTWVLKVSFQRERPVPFFDTVILDSYSFPSGHALISFCFYWACATVLCAGEARRWVRVGIWSLAAVLVLSIGYSRIYLGVHYPSDVVAGYLAALVWVIGVDVAYGRKNQH